MYGAVAGAVASLLVAPQSGRQTRDLLRYKSVQLRQMAQQKVDAAREKAIGMTERSKEYVDEQKERVSRLAQAVQQTAKDTWKEGDPGYQQEQREIKMVTPRL